MHLFLVVVAALAVAAEGLVPIVYNYHEQVGIPLAARIKAAEEATDFDGSRIAGGIPAPLGSQPHMGGLVITLTDDRQSVCGSSLLSNTRLVTAATCWRHRTTQARQFTVVLGSQRLFSGGQRINTDQVEVHAQYNDNNLNNDIAIIRINHVGFTNNINRVNLPTGNNQYVGVWAAAVGFGSNGDTGISQDPGKYQVALQVISNLLCSYTYGNNVVASTLCVATPNGRSTCQGDWGGPLTIGSGVFRELIGVASFGHMAGCTRNQPTAFSRVTSYVPWIRQRL